MIAGEEAALEKEKLEFIEKEKQLQALQHAFNELVQQLRNKEGEKNLVSQRVEFSAGKGIQPAGFSYKGAGQIKGLEESVHFTENQVSRRRYQTRNTYYKIWNPFVKKQNWHRTSFGIHEDCCSINCGVSMLRRNADNLIRKKILQLRTLPFKTWKEALKQQEEESATTQTRQIEQLGFDE